MNRIHPLPDTLQHIEKNWNPVRVQGMMLQTGVNRMDGIHWNMTKTSQDTRDDATD